MKIKKQNISNGAVKKISNELKKINLIASLVLGVFVFSLAAPMVFAVQAGNNNSGGSANTAGIDSINNSLTQLRKEKADFKNYKLQEDTEKANSLKEKVAAKRKIIEAKRKELRIKKEEKRKAVLVRLIDIQIKQLENTKERVEKMPNIKEELKASLGAKIDEAVEELGAEKTILQGIAAPEDLKKFAKELKDLFKSKREIVKQIFDAILASKADKAIVAAEGRLAEMKIKIAEMKAAGQDVAGLESLLTIAEGKITTANTKAGKEDLKGAINDLKEAYKNMKSIVEKTSIAE